MRAWTPPRPTEAEPVLVTEWAGPTLRFLLVCSRCHAVVAARGARHDAPPDDAGALAFGTTANFAWRRHTCPKNWRRRRRDDRAREREIRGR